MKQIFSKITAVCLVFIFIFSVNCGTIFAQDSLSYAISYLQDKKFMSAYTDGEFHEDTLLRRADLIRVIEGVFQIEPEISKNNNCYNDVKLDWYAPYICYAKNNKWLNSFENDFFHPLREITKEESLQILLRAFEIIIDQESGDDAANVIKTAQNMKIIDQFTEGETLTRGELADFLFKIIILKDFNKNEFNFSYISAFFDNQVKNDKEAASNCRNVFNRLEGERYNECLFRKISELEKGKYFDVVEVSDGDTIYINYFGSLERVRFLGIDTPELINKQNQVDCYAVEAKEETAKLLKGKKIKLEFDETNDDRDIYDRLLRYIYLEDDTFIDQYLVDNGFARFFEMYPSKYKETLEKGQEEAQKLNLGLWGSCK
jgi:micrococcal nuclease